METLACLIFAVLCHVGVTGKPRSRSEYETFTDVYMHTTERPDAHQEECLAAMRAETCSRIVHDMSPGINRQTDLRSALRYYCRNVQPFVPCLEANKNDYLMLMGCDDTMWDRLMPSTNMSKDEIWDLSINFLNKLNDIICSRTDELVDLVKCVENAVYVFEPKYWVCKREFTSPFLSVWSPNPSEPQELSEFCENSLGLGSCVRDAMAEVCEDSTPILDAFFDDLIVGVITNGVGCEPPSNPILSFVRSVRDKLRR